MSNFLNLNLDGKINTSFLFKHIIFSFFWILGLLLFLFRLDILFIDKLPPSPSWIRTSIPIFYFILLTCSLLFFKWYYILSFIFYPMLLLFWFIPKAILSTGKVYWFFNYLSSLLLKFYYYKQTLIHLCLIILSSLLFCFFSNNWVRWEAIAVSLYFYSRYVYKVIRKAFKSPTLFGTDIEEKIREFIKKNRPADSIIIKSYVNQKDDEKLGLIEKREKQIKRSVLANVAIEHISSKLNGFKRKQSYVISLILGAFIFMTISILFFWFQNFQLYKIDSKNFAYNGTFPQFDFLYYTLKTITFGDIELVKPITFTSRIVEIFSFLMLGIFFLVIFVSTIFSLKQDKMNENVKLTTDLIHTENLNLSIYFKEEFGMELTQAVREVKNIDIAVKNLHKIIDSIF